MNKRIQWKKLPNKKPPKEKRKSHLDHISLDTIDIRSWIILGCEETVLSMA